MSKFIESVIKKQEAEKKTVQSSVGSGTQSSKSTETPTTNWNTHFGDIDNDPNRLRYVDLGDDELNKVFMNSLNGQYKARILKNGLPIEGEGTLTGAFKDLGMTAWELAKLAKTTNHSQSDIEKIKALRLKFHDRYLDAQAQVSELGKYKEYDLAFDDQFRLVKFNHNVENGEALVVEPTDQPGKSGTTIKTTISPDYNPFNVWYKSIYNTFNTPKTKRELLDPYIVVTQETDTKSTYNKTLKYGKEMKELLTASYKPVVGEWLNTGLGNWNNDLFGTETEKIANKERTIELIKTGLTHIGKYDSGPDTRGKGDDKDAQKMLEEISKKSVDKELYAYIKENESEIKRLIGNMGYYGNHALLRIHDKNFSDLRYYPGTNDKERETNMNSYFNTIKVYTEHQDKFDAVRNEMNTKVKDELLKEKFRSKDSNNGVMDRGLYRLMFNEAGRPKTYDEVKAAYIKEAKPYKDNLGYTRYAIHGGVPNKKERYNQKEGYITVTYYDPTETNLRDAYEYMVDQYKNSYNDLQMDVIFDESLMTMGMGYDRTQFIGHDNINLKSSTGKNKNAHVLRSMLETELNLGKAYVAKGGYNQLVNESQFNDSPTEARAKLHEKFFDGDHNYDIRFSRATPLPGKSAYIVTRRPAEGKGKPMTLTYYVNTDAAEQYGEKYALGTKWAPQDFAYQARGAWDLKSWNSQFKHIDNVQIVTKGGTKYISANMWDLDQGKTVAKLVPIGADMDVSIQDAEMRAKEILTRYDNQVTEYIGRHGR